MQALKGLDCAKADDIPALKPPLARKVDIPGQQRSDIGIGKIVAVKGAAHLTGLPQIGTWGVLEKPAKTPDTGPRHKAHGRLKLLLHLTVGAENSPRIVGQAELAAPGQILGRARYKAAQDKGRELQVLIAPQLRGAVAEVSPGQAGRRSAFRSPAGGNEADRGFGQDIALDPDDAEVLAGHAAPVLGLHAHQADPIRPGPAAELSAAEHVNGSSVVRNPDPSAEKRNDDQRAGCRGQPINRKIAGVFQKELALLRKKERKTGQIDLGVVHLGFAEVGVQAHAEGQARRELVKHVQGRLEVGRPPPGYQ